MIPVRPAYEPVHVMCFIYSIWELGNPHCSPYKQYNLLPQVADIHSGNQNRIAVHEGATWGDACSVGDLGDIQLVTYG
jgi:hypothetical protein